MKNHTLLPASFPRDPKRCRRVARNAFSLTELLVGISIVGILLAITFPAAQAVRQAARRIHCLSNLKQVMIATLNYESNGTGFPPGDNGKGQGFMVSLLPFLEENRLSERSKDNLVTGERYRDRWRELSQEQVVSLICPAASPQEHQTTLANQGEFTSHYYGIAGPVGTARDFSSLRQYSYRHLYPEANGRVGLQGIFSPRSDGVFVSKRLKDVTDGTSNTFGIGEISQFNVVDANQNPNRPGWAFGAGYDSTKHVTHLYGIKSLSAAINSIGENLNDTPFSSNHPGGTQFALLDGSTHFVDQGISVDVLKVFASINQREKTGSLDRY